MNSRVFYQEGLSKETSAVLAPVNSPIGQLMLTSS